MVARPGDALPLRCGNRKESFNPLVLNPAYDAMVLYLPLCRQRMYHPDKVVEVVSDLRNYLKFYTCFILLNSPSERSWEHSLNFTVESIVKWFCKRFILLNDIIIFYYKSPSDFCPYVM